MSGSRKFLGISYRFWWGIYFCINATLIILMGSTMAKLTWVYSENDQMLINSDLLADGEIENYLYDGSIFEGTISECTESCDENYVWLAKKWCDYKDYLEDIGSYEFDSDYIDKYKSVCLMFTNIMNGIYLYVYFEWIAMVAVFIWTIGMLCYCRKVNCLWLTYFCSGCSWASHYIALISFMSISNAGSSTDCDEFPKHGYTPKLCYGSGPSLSLTIFGIFPIVVVLYCVIACCLKKHHGYDGLVHITITQTIPPPVIVTGPSFVAQPYMQTTYYPAVVQPTAQIYYQPAPVYPLPYVINY